LHHDLRNDDDYNERNSLLFHSEFEEAWVRDYTIMRCVILDNKNNKKRERVVMLELL